MKKITIAAVLAMSMSTGAFARQVTESPEITIHATSGSRAAQLNNVKTESNVLCRMRFVTTTSDDGVKTTRKSVDCQE